VGGGSRGSSAHGLLVEALVPSEGALTTQAQPSVYWYQSKPTNNLCEFTLTKPGEAKPLLNLKTSKPVPEGIHAIKLRKYAVALEPDVVYRWTLAIVVDPANRSQDILAEGVIKRVSPSPDLAKALASAGPANEALVYAANGIWVDALQAISEQIESSPKDQALRKARSSLLDQVDLPLAVDETP
jgi:hypothetical protein